MDDVSHKFQMSAADFQNVPVAYSNDLRWRIVWLNVLLEVTAQDIAIVMHLSERTVYRYADRYRATGEVRPLVKRNGRARLMCEFEELGWE